MASIELLGQFLGTICNIMSDAAFELQFIEIHTILCKIMEQLLLECSPLMSLIETGSHDESAFLISSQWVFNLITLTSQVLYCFF